jgi:hypothetical protein
VLGIPRHRLGVPICMHDATGIVEAEERQTRGLRRFSTDVRGFSQGLRLAPTTPPNAALRRVQDVTPRAKAIVRPHSFG